MSLIEPLTGVVAALGVEARPFGPPRRRGAGVSSLNDGTLVVVSGMGGAAAAAAARRLVDAGAGALISWGMAGALDPLLPAGTICLPIVVISRDGASFPTDQRWRERVCEAIAAKPGTAAAGHPMVAGKLLTNARTIDDVAGKAAAFRTTGALAVDMESTAIAEVAAHHGLPFIAVRVIVDTAADTLPRSVREASAAGQVHIGRLVLGLVRSPRDIAPLLRLARRYRAATRALTAVARSGAVAPQVLPGAAAGPSTVRIA